MNATVFLAGASGAIGRRLTPLLLDAGFVVYGMTRDASKAADLERAGVRAVVADVYDPAAVREAMAAVKPEVVVHQLTDLPQSIESGLSDEELARNARVRVDGTKNLVDAALQCSARAMVAQSLIASYAPGPEPHTEADPLDASRSSVITLERLVLESPPLAGAVLRFGRFYGPGTWYSQADGSAPVHVDAAAYATLFAIQRGARGAFNIAEDRGYATSARARNELGWSAELRLPAQT